MRLVLVAEPDWSDRRIAEHVGVGHTFVAKVREDIQPQLESDSSCEPRNRVGKDGKARKVPAKKSFPKPQPSEPVKQAGSADSDERDESTPNLFAEDDASEEEPPPLP